MNRGVHRMLGRPSEKKKKLILLAGPDGGHLERVAVSAGFRVHTNPRVSDPDELRRFMEENRCSLVAVRCIPEIEGVLDRSAFTPYVGLAYAATRVVYAGPSGAVLVWPQRDDRFLRISSGVLQAQRPVETSEAVADIPS